MRVKSIEWSAAVSRLLSSVEISYQATHFVLPDLKSTSERTRIEFRSAVPRAKRIETLAINGASEESWLAKSLDVGISSDNILVVGGNNKVESQQLSTPAAIQKCTKNSSDPTKTKVWAVLDPNSPEFIDDAYRKYDAGACNFIMQPVLGSKGYERVSELPARGALYVAGIALPKTLRGLRFWQSLLSPNCDLDTDPLFRDHCSYFEKGGDAAAWTKDSVDRVSKLDIVQGLHLMPLNNTIGLLKLLSESEN